VTRGQQIVLLVLGLALISVIALLAVTLINRQGSDTPQPTLAVLTTATVPQAAATAASLATVTAPPTWTAEPSRTSPATNTPRGTSTATPTPSVTPTFAPTFTPRPTEAVTPTASSPTGTIRLENPGFEGVGGNFIPGWDWWAEDNFTPGGEYNPDSSYETPLFKQADDPVRFITGPTLQIDAVQHLKFRVHVFQTAAVPPNAQVRFEVKAGAYSDSGAVQIAAGVVPQGDGNCNNARWSETIFVDQEGGVQRIVAPLVNAGDSGKVTVCLYAEPLYPAISNAAFFDDAELTLNP
jgi:hypothetical protein